ncbi:hypothetical protein LINPERPRIM_LOCUS12354 [Linum perenne]
MAQTNQSAPPISITPAGQVEVAFSSYSHFFSEPKTASLTTAAAASSSSSSSYDA